MSAFVAFVGIAFAPPAVAPARGCFIATCVAEACGTVAFASAIVGEAGAAGIATLAGEGRGVGALAFVAFVGGIGVVAFTVGGAGSEGATGVA
ncbi:MAG: hypothetical protein ACYDCK_00055 [Thermoplasmatota archaeon]